MSTNQSRTPEEKAKNHVTLSRKLPWKSCSTTHLPFLSPNPKILKAFLKTFPIKIKPTKCPAKEKKWGEKAKSKSQDCYVTFKLEILLSAHARTSHADILQLDQKAAKCTTCKQHCGKFQHDSDQKTSQQTLKGVFQQHLTSSDHFRPPFPSVTTVNSLLTLQAPISTDTFSRLASIVSFGL